MLSREVTHDSSRNRAADHGVEQEAEEVFVVVQANAVADPRAMMVHAEDASAAE